MAKTEPIGNLMRRFSVIVFLATLIACNPNEREPVVYDLNPAPTFNEDSAYQFIKEQVDFGFRIPGTEAHQKCGDYLVAKLNDYGFEVEEQIDTILGYDKKEFPLRNIIAKLNPEKEKRLLLCANWDTRPVADQDTENPTKPIDGANDNASGIGVVLEIARHLGKENPANGVDIVLFDMQDQGRPAYEIVADQNDHGYCLGSEYWSKNLSGIKPEFGILLDMVGAENAEFTLEQFSMQYAEPYVLEIWDVANQLGYENNFLYNRTQQVYDDHMNVNQIAQIPCVDIIHQDVQNHTLFWSHWHTHNDRLETINKPTLKAVGHTVTQVLYNQ